MSELSDKAEAPCRHMERLLQEAASNRSRGLVRWYTLAHAARCGRCGRFLASVRGIIGKLRDERATATDQDAVERLAAKLGP